MLDKCVDLDLDPQVFSWPTRVHPILWLFLLFTTTNSIKVIWERYLLSGKSRPEQTLALNYRKYHLCGECLFSNSVSPVSIIGACEF